MAHNPQQQPIPQSPQVGAGPAGNQGNGSLTRPLPTPAQPARPSGSAPIPLRQGQAMPRDDVDEEQSSPLSDYFRSAPPWLVSAVFHLTLLLLLGLLFLANSKKQIEILSKPWAEDIGDLLEDDAINLESLVPIDFKSITKPDLILVEDPFSAPPEANVQFNGENAISKLLAPNIGNALKGRQDGSRDFLLRKYGGGAKTELAVKNALIWLKKQQAADGSWSLSGPYGEGVKPAERASATAMALLAFQGNGNTHKQGKYKDVVDKGVKWLMNRQQENGSWRPDGDRDHHRMYIHGQCTIALCELYGMTQDSTIRSAAERAVQYCIKWQGDEGGWRYAESKKEHSDTSVTGWILMGLQSAKMAGIKVPDLTFKNISKFLDSVAASGGSRYGYMSPNANLVGMTAEALLCRQYLGWKRDNKDLQSGIQHLLKKENLPRWQRYDDFNGAGRDVYYWYYATQALHHMEGPGWDRWNAAMKPALVNSQEKRGREIGSWDPDGDKWGSHGGRLYVTCLCVYMLEVYYRHLPIYSKIKLR